MAIFQEVNNNIRVNFNLESADGTFTVRIATTLSFGAGRPQIEVNDWTSAVGPAPDRIDSRGVTRGAYRGFGEQYDFGIPSRVLKKGANTLTIMVNSGATSGEGFLSPNFVSNYVLRGLTSPSSLVRFPADGCIDIRLC
jgi:rhamnogalacturonan endolyase